MTPSHPPTHSSIHPHTRTPLKVEELVEALPSLQKVVVVGMAKEREVEWTSKRAKELVMSWDDFLASGSEEDGAARALITIIAIIYRYKQQNIMK